MNLDERKADIMNITGYIPNSLTDRILATKPEIHKLEYDLDTGEHKSEVWLIDNLTIIPVVGGLVD